MTSVSQSRPNRKSPRRYALDIFSDVIKNKAYCNLRIKSIQDFLEERDVRFVSALLYTTLDRLFYIDHVLEDFVRKTPKPVLKNLLRLGVCELLFLRTPSHAVLNEYVNLAKDIGMPQLKGFVNAVLRNIDKSRENLPALPENPIQRISEQYSCPEWIVQMWLDSYGEDNTIAILQSSSVGMTLRPQYPETAEALIPKLPVSVSRGKMDANALLLHRGFNVTEHPSFQSGEMTIQSEGAMLVSRALGPAAGKRILDACAAPGGKSAYIASLSENDADLVCFELHQHRVNLLNKTFARLHVSADIEQRDAAVFDPEYENDFDIVLLDVPCSGLGLLHEKPDLRYNKMKEDVQALIGIQNEILNACCRYVKAGGLLVYSTCTISKDENEYQVRKFLNEHKDFTPDCLPFADSFELQLLPHIHGTDGFYIARMKRICN